MCVDIINSKLKILHDRFLISLTKTIPLDYNIRMDFGWSYSYF